MAVPVPFVLVEVVVALGVGLLGDGPGLLGDDADEASAGVSRGCAAPIVRCRTWNIAWSSSSATWESCSP